MHSERFIKRNTIHLDPPNPDSEEERARQEAHHASFGKFISWNDTPVEEEDHSEDEDDNLDSEEELDSEEDSEEELDSEDEDSDEQEEEFQFPDELLCPHCGARARTEASYLKNHGDNCHQKPE
jgi:hypothetical protein